MLNKIILIGRLTRDPEAKSTTSGNSVATFTLAVDRSFTNQSGEREADFIPIVTWRKLAETCAKFLSKGRLVSVYGRLQVRSYDASDGTKRYISEVVADEVQFLEKKQDGQAQPSQKPQFEAMEEVDNDELPF